MNRLAATLADPLGQMRQLAGLDQQEAFAETPQEKQARIYQQLQDPATKQQALEEALGPSMQAATEALGKIGGIAAKNKPIMPLFITNEGNGFGDAAAGMDSHGTLLNKLGLDNTPENAAKLGLHYVDSGGAIPHVISGPEVSTQEAAVKAAQAFATNINSPVKLTYGDKSITLNTQASFNWQELHEALGELKKPSGGPAKVYSSSELPQIVPGVASANLNPPLIDPAKNVAMQVLQSSHGIDPRNVARIQTYTRESPESILGRFDKARQNAIEMGLGPENTAAERAGLWGARQDIGEPGAWLQRGSNTPRAVLETPAEWSQNIEGNAKAALSEVSGTPHAVFGSFPAGTEFELDKELSNAYGSVHTPLVARFGKEDLFDPRKPGHVATALEYGMPHHFTEAFANMGTYPGGTGRIDYTLVESPRVIDAIKQAGFPGILTTEGHSLNWGSFNPTDLRHPLAAFDPARAEVRNLFAGLAATTPIAALAAALARQQQPPVAPVQ